MSYVEQGIGKRFGSLTTFLLQLDPTCFLENKQKKSSSMYSEKFLSNIFKKIFFFFQMENIICLQQHIIHVNIYQIQQLVICVR